MKFGTKQLIGVAVSILSLIIVIRLISLALWVMNQHDDFIMFIAVAFILAVLIFAYLLAKIIWKWFFTHAVAPDA